MARCAIGTNPFPFLEIQMYIKEMKILISAASSHHPNPEVLINAVEAGLVWHFV